MKNTNSRLTFILSYLLFLWSVKSSATTPAHIRLDATGSSMQNETVVYFDGSGSFTYNSLTDSPSLGVNPGYLNIVSRFDNIDYQIKGLPPLNQNMDIPIKILTGVSGVYSISASDIQNVPSGACLLLHDNYTNANTDLRLGAYVCTVIDTESVARFILTINIIVIPISSSVADPTCSKSADGFMSAVGLLGTGPWDYYWKDSLNNIIKTTLAKNTADTMFNVNAGWYSVDVTSYGTCTNGSTNYYLHGSQSPYSLFTSSVDTTSLTQPVFFFNNSMIADNYWWDFGDGIGTNEINPSHYYASPGTFIVTLTAISSFCGDSALQTKEIVVTAGTTALTQTPSEVKNIIITRDQIGYFVTFNFGVPQNVVISVSDILGNKIKQNIEINNVQNEKFYVSTNGYENQVLIISAIASNGVIVYKKIIN